MKDILRRFLLPCALLTAVAPSAAAARAADEPAGQAKAVITVLVPPDAELVFDGNSTTQKGAERLFVSPPLPVGKKYHYVVVARWNEGGKPVEQTREVDFTPGEAVRVDFRALAAEPKEKGAEVAKSVGPPGRLIRREGGPRSPWQPLGDQAPVFADELLIGVPGAELETKDGTVRLRFRKYFNSPLPVLEPAVTLHAGPDYDLDFTLERGMVEVSNNKKSGSACVQIRDRGEKWEAILKEPGARLLVEEYSAWPKGMRFTKKPGPKDVPLAQMVFLVLQGEMELRHAGNDVAMSAPPGPALIEWDSTTGMDESPQRLEALPDWVLPPKDEAGKAFAKKYEEIIGRFADEAAKAQSLDPVIDKLLASNDPMERRLGVVALAATDQLPRLAEVLKDSDKPDVWDNAVLALRHWIGRAPGQDQILYQGIIDRKIFTPREAQTAIELLHDFSDDDLARPVTYELLINLLGSDKRFIRGLAYWHLSRLVPEGKKFGYDPFGPQEARDQAIKMWREFIPAGKLPPPPKEEGK